MSWNAVRKGVWIIHTIIHPSYDEVYLQEYCVWKMLQPLHSAYHFYTTVPFFFCITSILYPLIARRLRPIRDVTEKVLFTCKSIQNKVCLLISQYYILHIKLVFQWRPKVWDELRRLRKIGCRKSKLKNTDFLSGIIDV